MAPLMFLVGGTLAGLVAGRAGVPRLRPWPVALRGGLALMFTVTGIAHFVGMRQELIDMVPPALPAPEFLVTVTGVLELAGAAALLWRPAAPWAAGGLGLMLVGMFPANVHLALNGTDLPWDDRLVPRTGMQVVFLAATLAVAAHYARDARRTQSLDSERTAARAQV
ncbi:DoxX family membrane protein [Actinomadura sp. KC345]|uniref:DoxX family protein n=1 Tax=Actinomadura sp. KC345 TaxID=2530371 RepID=UPI00105361C9|nr:DoxX family membrane protein [Actinomadura sp. KC345]TDC53689.1 DoxX family membrane protein [Actinomadura sp. KC345]